MRSFHDELRFAAFAALYALAAVLDHAQMGTVLGATPGTVAIAAAVVVLFVPRSAAALGALFLAQGAFFASEMPHVSNLGLFHLCICATGVAGMAALVLRRAWAWSGPALLDAVGPALRLELVVVYAWSCWHKLNTDFFDPELSCAVALYEKVRWGLAFLPLPEGQGIATLLIVATLAIEGGLPLLLVPRRTRGLGVALGVGFHVALGFGYYYAFSSASIAVLALFLPAAFWERLSRGRLARLATPARWRAAVLAGIALYAAARAAYGWHPDRTALANLASLDTLGNQFTRRVWWLYLGVAALSLAALRTGLAGSGERAREHLRPRPAWLLAFPLLLLADGASPYLGLKTEYSFAMYSNLRTEGGRTNHLLVPRPLDLWGYQRDLVRVSACSSPAFRRVLRLDLPMPFVELRNRVHDARRAGGDFSLTYERGGAVHAHASVAAAPELARPSPLERFLTFREIRWEHNTCAH